MMAHTLLAVPVEVNSCIIPYYLLANFGVAIILHCCTYYYQFGILF